jgi:hypothetical protein
MRFHGRRVTVSVLLFLVLAPAAAAAIPSPSKFLDMTVGADRALADYRQIARYFRALDEASERVTLELLGRSTLGEEMLMAVISSEANLRNLDRIREISRRLADPRGLSDAELDALAHEGKAVVLITCSIHATEIGASQMAMEWVHALATAQDDETKRRLDRVVLLLVPSLNPDGSVLEVDWYRKQLGTRYEGSRMPWLYHHYVGHDNNRDWFMLTQAETRAMSHAVYHRWFPQIWLDEHQMGSTGPRMFLPPYAEPVDPDIHPLVWREANLIGSHMALRLEQAGKSGVIYGYAFDAYWPGGTKNTAWWKNITGLLTEIASVRLATPVFVPPGELSGSRKGLIEYGPQTNFPNPWPGGWWRLRDILDYARIASDALHELAADRREDLLRNQAARAREAIGRFGPDDAWRIPADQHDPATAHRLAELMLDHGLEVMEGEGGDLWIPLHHPYGRFVEEMFTTQRFNEVRLVAGHDPVEPYDVSAWTLPLMMGVTAERGTLPDGLRPYMAAPPALPLEGQAFALAPRGPEDARLVNAALRSKGRVYGTASPVEAAGRTWPAGTVFLDPAAAQAAAAQASAGQGWTGLDRMPKGLSPRTAPRVGLYKPWLASMDEGWTRFLLERFGFEPKTLDNAAIRAGKLRDRFDAIVLPDVAKEVIAEGKPARREGQMRYFPEPPPEYAGGIGKEGAQALQEFVEAGGTLVAMASSTLWVLGEFNIPVRNALHGAKPEEFSSRGSLVRAQIEADHPVIRGLPAEVALFVDKAIAFETAPPGAELERWVLAAYPGDSRGVLLSGWVRGEERLARRAAAVATTYGKGKLVLLGFRPQHRAQTPGTYPFLFNALWWATGAQ